MRFVYTTLFIISFAASAYAEENISIYSDLDPKLCKQTGQAEEGDGDWVSWQCKGLNDLDVNWTEADLRNYLSYGKNGKEQTVFSETIPNFNSIGGKLEWRVKKGGAKQIPVATILRYTISHSEEPDKKAQVLAVTKLDDKDACHIAYIDAQADKNANETARKIADTEAASFVCGKDEPKNKDFSKYVYK